MKIYLSKGRFTLISSQDYGNLSQWKWCFYPSRGGGYAGRKVGNTTIYMHRVIMNPIEGLQVDHINHDGLDNRRSNLRVVTPAQNMANVRLSSRNNTGYKGVHFFKRTKQFTAYIGVEGKTRHLGYFATAVEAAKAYNKAALELRGEFAYLNRVGG